MFTKAEAAILDRQDHAAVICRRCGATLGEYRRGEKCSAALDDPCEGFIAVEAMLAGKTTQRTTS